MGYKTKEAEVMISKTHKDIDTKIRTLHKFPESALSIGRDQKDVTQGRSNTDSSQAPGAPCKVL